MNTNDNLKFKIQNAKILNSKFYTRSLELEIGKMGMNGIVWCWLWKGMFLGGWGCVNG